jgi:hypothetical protein
MSAGSDACSLLQRPCGLSCKSRSLKRDQRTRRTHALSAALFLCFYPGAPTESHFTACMTCDLSSASFSSNISDERSADVRAQVFDYQERPPTSRIDSVGSLNTKIYSRRSLRSWVALGRLQDRLRCWCIRIGFDGRKMRPQNLLHSCGFGSASEQAIHLFDMVGHCLGRLCLVLRSLVLVNRSGPKRSDLVIAIGACS